MNLEFERIDGLGLLSRFVLCRFSGFQIEISLPWQSDKKYSFEFYLPHPHSMKEKQSL